MHFTRFAGSDVEAFDPMIELEQVKNEMARADPQESEAESRKVDGKEGEAEPLGNCGKILVVKTSVVRRFNSRGQKNWPWRAEQWNWIVLRSLRMCLAHTKGNGIAVWLQSHATTWLWVLDEDHNYDE
ncbi:hypothetical protein BC827DRAFT_1159544 [Russula dissimulans]|nr:hypothetical protein BC827DRAFT_1159544 [Russula dissimulans]